MIALIVAYAENRVVLLETRVAYHGKLKVSKNGLKN